LEIYLIRQSLNYKNIDRQKYRRGPKLKLAGTIMMTRFRKSIPASSDTGESDEAVLNKVLYIKLRQKLV
jgi:hypothetical protein